MERRSFLSLVGSSPIFSYINDWRTEKTKEEIYKVESICAHYTDYRQQIEYRCEGCDILTVSYEDREYEDWFNTVSRDARNQESSVPIFTVLSDCNLKLLYIKPDYAKSVFEKGEYEIYIHSSHTDGSQYMVQYHEKGDMENMTSFEADSRMEIDAKLDRRNVIF